MLSEWMKPPLPWCDYHVHSWGNFSFKALRPAVKYLDSSATAGIITSGKNTLLLPQQRCPLTAGSLHYDEFLQFKARIHFIRSHPTLIGRDSINNLQMQNKKRSHNTVSCPAKNSSQRKILKNDGGKIHPCFMSARTRISLIFVASVCPHCIVVYFKKYQNTTEWKEKEADRSWQTANWRGRRERMGGAGGTHQLTEMHHSGGVCRQLIQRLWVVWCHPFMPTISTILNAALRE